MYMNTEGSAFWHSEESRTSLEDGFKDFQSAVPDDTRVTWEGDKIVISNSSHQTSLLTVVAFVMSGWSLRIFYELITVHFSLLQLIIGLFLLLWAFGVFFKQLRGQPMLWIFEDHLEIQYRSFNNLRSSAQQRTPYSKILEIRHLVTHEWDDESTNLVDGVAFLVQDPRVDLDEELKQFKSNWPDEDDLPEAMDYALTLFYLIEKDAETAEAMAKALNALISRGQVSI